MNIVMNHTIETNIKISILPTGSFAAETSSSLIVSGVNIHLNIILTFIPPNDKIYILVLNGFEKYPINTIKILILSTDSILYHHLQDFIITTVYKHVGLRVNTQPINTLYACL